MAQIVTPWAITRKNLAKPLSLDPVLFAIFPETLILLNNVALKTPSFKSSLDYLLYNINKYFYHMPQAQT